MEIDKPLIIQALLATTGGKTDGGRKNIVVPECPWCGKQGGKYGIYIGPEAYGKTLFASHCFSCGRSTVTLPDLLKLWHREDLMPQQTAILGKIDVPDFFLARDKAEEIDTDLEEAPLPAGYKRTYKNYYLASRGFTFDDYDVFPVGTTRGTNFKLDDYVIFPITDGGVNVGYVARHTWGKRAIDEYNEKARAKGRYAIRRYTNSTDNDFSRLLYNYDNVEEDVTDTVILCEGVFDVISLTRKLNLYDNHRCVPVACFGKKISDVQIYKLQSKGVTDVIVGFDGDAGETIKRTACMLEDYFDVTVARIQNPEADFDSMDADEIYDIFANNLMTPAEYRLRTLTLKI